MNSLSVYDELDQAIGAMIANPKASSASLESGFADVLRIASDLLQLPRPDFKARLKTELEWVASARPLSSTVPLQATADANILPSLFGRDYGTYPIRRVNFATSVGLHAAAMLVTLMGVMAFKDKPKEVQPSDYVKILSDYVPPPGLHQMHGGGSGGDADKQKASTGTLLRTASEQFTPPTVIPRNEHSRLEVEPTIIAPDLKAATTDQVGDPLSKLMTPSNGIGVGGGIGSVSGGGIGDGRGPGYGPGSGGDFGGEIYRPGNGVIAPKVIYDPEPEYSPEARAAKYQGTVKLWAIIGADGRPRNLSVERSLGMGLDEKALEAVRTWRFHPATKDGQPVAVQIEVEVSFHLY